MREPQRHWEITADTAPLREYARQVFSVPFPPEAVITENRWTEAEFLGDSTDRICPLSRLGLRHGSGPRAVPIASRQRWQRGSNCSFPGWIGRHDVDGLAWRIALGGLLKKHLLFVNLLKLLKGQIVSLTDLQQQMRGHCLKPRARHIGKVLDALLVLVAWAREPGWPAAGHSEGATLDA